MVRRAGGGPGSALTDHKTTVRRPLSSILRPQRRQLVVVSSPDRDAVERCIALDEEVVVGRGVGGDGGIRDPALSRRHFRVVADGDGLAIEDLGGANGTFVDATRLSGRRPLGGDAVVWAGDTLLVVETEPSEEGLAVAHDVDGARAAAFIGRSPYADRIRRALETAATADGAVLILGPSGAGKEVSSRIIHEISGRAGPCIAVNCAAIPGELAESELFGHERGAFTGADQAKKGHFAQADGGTLFLDEVGELPAPLQSKLLRVLETGVVQPVGGRPFTVDVRVVAATNRDVHDSASFRGDLLARLSDWIIRLPGLAARRGDVLTLFRTFAERAGAHSTTTPLFDAALVNHDWPHNVRELEKLARRLGRLARPGQPLDLQDLPPGMRERLVAASRPPIGPPSGGIEAADPEATWTPDGADASSTESRPRVTVPIPSREALEAALTEAAGNIKQIARDRGWHRMQIYRWMQKYGLDPSDYR